MRARRQEGGEKTREWREDKRVARGQVGPEEEAAVNEGVSTLVVVLASAVGVGGCTLPTRPTTNAL